MSGRPLRAYLHDNKPPKIVYDNAERRNSILAEAPSVPFNSNDIPFMSIKDHRIDNHESDFAPSKNSDFKIMSRRSDTKDMENVIEDDFINNAKVVEITEQDARVNSKFIPFLPQNSDDK